MKKDSVLIGYGICLLAISEVLEKLDTSNFRLMHEVWKRELQLIVLQLQ